MDSILSRSTAAIKTFGFDHFGFAPLSRPLSLDLYREWLAQSYHGTMSYLESHLPLKADPQLAFPAARSAIVIAQNYVPHPAATGTMEPARVALYAQGADYHHWFLNKLEQVADVLRREFPAHTFACATDSRPLLERDLAVRAGLGWIGKNTCVLHQKKGSLFFLGEIVTSLDFEAPTVLHPDRCGTCTRCLEACPTNALIAPRVLDARRCISYLTIEAKDDPPEDLRRAMGDWLFGCDICQTVCPWNQKVLGTRQDATAGSGDRADLVAELRWILTSSVRQIHKRLTGTPLLRAGGRKLQRSALIVAANRGLVELQGEVQRMAREPSPVQPLARWACAVLEQA